MKITILSSNEQVLAELGARIRAARIDTPLTQAELAERAGLSPYTVANLERGHDVNLGSLLSVLRALGMLENANALVPETLARPVDVARLGHARQRATSPSRRTNDASAWQWGDER